MRGENLKQLREKEKRRGGKEQTSKEKVGQRKFRDRKTKKVREKKKISQLLLQEEIRLQVESKKQGPTKNCRSRCHEDLSKSPQHMVRSLSRLMLRPRLPQQHHNPLQSLIEPQRPNPHLDYL